MRRIVCYAAVALAASLSIDLPLSAQAPQSRPKPEAAPALLPEAREVLERHIKAIGGRDAIMTQTSRRVSGTITMPSTGMTGSFEMFEARPNKAVMRMTLAGIGEMSEGFNGEVAWSISPVTGPTLLEGRQLEEKKLDSDFFGDLQLEKRYASIETVDRVDFEGRPCYKLRLARRDGGEDVHFYDTATGLRAGSVMSRETPLGSITATIVEADYKRFGDVMYPTKMINTAMNVQQILTVMNVQFNNVEPGEFEPPPTIKALIK